MGKKKGTDLLGSKLRHKGEVTMFTVKTLSKITGLSPNTIRAYHKRSVIPQPLWVRTTGRHGWNLYSTNQIYLIKSVFKALHDPKNTEISSLSDVSLVLKKEWGKDENQ